MEGMEAKDRAYCGQLRDTVREVAKYMICLTKYMIYRIFFFPEYDYY